MDIKLKNNKKTVNKNFIIISLCISLLPILLGLSNGFFKLDRFSYEEYVLNVLKGIPYKDGNGHIREDVISKTIDDFKNQNKYSFEYSKKNLEEFSKKVGIDPNNESKAIKDNNISGPDYLTYSQLKDDYNSAKDELNKSEAEYMNDAIKDINQNLDNRELQENQKNIEYYAETQDGQIISNINDKSKNEIAQETKSISKHYIIILNINKNLPSEMNITNNMKWAYDDFLENGKVNYLLSDFKDVIIRISNPMQIGDEIYSKTKKNTLYDTISYGSLLLFIVDLCILFVFIKKLIKEKKLKSYEDTNINILEKCFVEIRLFAIGLFITLLSGLYDITAYWGDSLIERYYSNILANQYLLRIFPATFYVQILSLFAGTIIIGYLVMCDVYQLYSRKTMHELKQYAYSKSASRIIYNKLKDNISNLSTAKRFTIFSIIIALYFGLIFYETVFYSRRAFFYVSKWYMLIVFFIINILGTALLIIHNSILLINIKKIKTGTDNIINETYKNEIKIRGSFILKELADNIMNIEEGLGKAIDKAVKSERMRSELITNVSHDLKTPLTSIITYADLLDKENVPDEKRREYLNILKERSSRLKILIEDLFEVSKASSGNLEIHMEILDPIALLRQTLGEFEDKIKKSNLDFIKSIPERKLTIYADGKKTFRIFQNLISNILKYSLNGTRVYIDIEDENNFISITFKNISKHPLNFTEEEILERFKRGDSSRTTEGSGLGLAIAKSLVELQKGVFELKFDGDLFKVKILLKKENF